MNEISVFHAMDSVTRFLSCEIVSGTALKDAKLEFESCWLGQFWPPVAVLGDSAFSHSSFIDYLQAMDTEYKPIHHVATTKMFWNPSTA